MDDLEHYMKKVSELSQELADLRKELENAIGLKNTYHNNWQEAKSTIDYQAEVINNLTVRWGKKCREYQELIALVEKMVGLRKKVNGLKYEPHLMCKVDDMWKEAEAHINKAKGG